jgi:hypothetical protein
MKSRRVPPIVLTKGKKSESVLSVCRFSIYRPMFKVDCENGLNFLADAKGLGGNSDIMNRDNGYKYKKR